MNIQAAPSHDVDPLLRDGARRALADLDAPPPDAAGVDADAVARVWRIATELGWPLLLIPEDHGGVGGTVAQAAVLAEEVGYALAPGPFAATLALAPTIAAVSHDPGFRAAVCDAITRGGRIVVARPTSGGPIEMVHDLVGATHAVIIDQGAASLLDLSHPAVMIATTQPLDPTSSIGTIFHEGARDAAVVTRLNAEDDQLLGPYRVMVAAECVGLAARSVALALEHVQQRKQFGVAIGSFQAVKHRLADMVVRLEDARALTGDAARACDADRADRLPAIDAALAAAAEAALRCAADAIQLHGALGVCWEHPCHLVYKRARRLIAAAADPAEARRRLAARLIGR